MAGSAEKRLPRQMKLGLMYHQAGHHIASWLHPNSWPDCALNLEKTIEIARIAERGLFDFIFEADSLSGERFTPDTLPMTALGMRIDPLTLLTALATATDQIGLVCTATTTYDQPYHIARKFASLDLVSGGRSGWNVVTSANATEARNFGVEEHLPKSERYRRAREFVDVVRGLWDSWDENSLILNRDSGKFYDQKGLHVLNHDGEFFKVRGPLTAYRSPQGHPIIVQAGASDDGRLLAGQTAEVVFTAQQALVGAQEFYVDVKRHAADAGRDPSTVLIMPGFGVMVAPTRWEAEDKYQKLQDMIATDVGIMLLSRYLACDLRGYDVDGPLPDLPLDRDVPSRAALLLETGKREGLSIRQTYQRIAGGRGHFQVTGSVEEVADTMQMWLEENAADGFNVLPPVFPVSLIEIVDLLIPELQRRGIFRKEYEGLTLREKLGLPYPVSRYAKAPASDPFPERAR